MKTYINLLILGILLTLSSCVSDTPADKATATTQAQTANKSRPTEGMKVNLPNGKKTVVPKDNKAVQDFKDNSGKKAKEKIQAKQQADIKKSMDFYGGKILPSACELVSPAFIADLMDNVNADYITVRDGSGKNAVDAKACFFKWDGSRPNGGILVQVQRNPLPEEFPDWASYYVNGKKNQGDKTADGSATHRYKDFPGMGVAGAYSADLSRYVWRTEKDNVFMIAFNLDATETQQLDWARKIGKEVMKNFDKKSS